MAKCPNCGREAARTSDWVCEWCGYPLPDGSFKKIDKTFRQLKEERLTGRLSADETKPSSGPKDAHAPVINMEALAKLRAAPRKPEGEPETVAKPEQTPASKTPASNESKPTPIPTEVKPPLAVQVESSPEKKAAPIAKVELSPIVKAEKTPEAKPESKPPPVSEVKPDSAQPAKLESSAEGKAATAPEVKTEPPHVDIELTVGELLSAYEADGVAADARFCNKILKITGVVDKVSVKEALDIYSITLNSPKKSLLLQGVRCVFGKAFGLALNHLSAGQTVTVQGKYTGSMIDISLRDCILVS